MEAEYVEMWKKLDMDVDKHTKSLANFPKVYENVFLTQKNRPKAMEYFDYLISEIHKLRVKEILDAKKQGRKVVGVFCLYIPQELVIALDAIYVGLCGGSNSTVGVAEQFLPRNICPLIKSSFGFKAARLCPYFQSSDLLVGETTCDGKKKMFELMSNLCPTYVVQLAPKPQTSQTKTFFLEELKCLKSELESLTGKKLTVINLKRAIDLINKKRAVLKRLLNTRKASPPPISGKDALLVSQISLNDDTERFIQKANKLAEELEERAERGEGVVDADTPRLLVSGCPMALPNWKLHNIVENSGAVIVAEESCVGTRYFGMGEVDNSADSLDGLLESIAEAYLNIHCACFTPNTGRIDDIIKLAKDFKVNGVIYYSLQNCDDYNIEARKVENALKEINIPMLTIETDYSDEDTGQLRTRVEAFIEMIRK